jgi:hypothetical protein
VKSGIQLEVTTSQTRLNQVFAINPTDRYLSFTLSGAALNDPLPLAGEGTNGAQGAAQTLQRTYRVDLSGIAAGTAVNLSFDLLGLGKASSHITVSDVRNVACPHCMMILPP